MANTQSGKHLHHRLFALLLALGIAVLLASTACLIVGSLTRTVSSAGTAALPKGTTALNVGDLLQGIVNNKGKVSKAQAALLERPYISFIGDSLSPSDEKLAGTLEVIIPPGIPPQMTDSSGKALFANCPSNCTPLPSTANESIVAQILVSKGSANFEAEESIKLKDLFTGSILGIHDYPLTIPLKGFAGQYPQDDYTGDVSLSLTFPSKKQFTSGTTSLVRAIDAGPVSNTYSVSVTKANNYQKIISNSADTFYFSATRDWYNEFFVYAVSCVPLLFAILFMHLLFVSPGRGPRPGQEFRALYRGPGCFGVVRAAAASGARSIRH